MPHRRDFLKTLAAGAAGTYVTGPGLGHASSLVQAQRPRRRVLEAPFLGAAEKEAILGGNSTRLFRM